MRKPNSFWQRASSLGRAIREVGLVITAVGLLLVTDNPALAQGGEWSEPVMISTNTASSWFSDVAVDPWGQPHIVWNSGRPTDREQIDLLMYSTLDSKGWLEPNDIAVTAYGGYTVRPAIAVDSAGTLHVTFRGETAIYITNAPASEAWDANAWTTRRRISGASAGGAYYSDIAVDDQDGIHIVWGETISAGLNERWLWFGAEKGASVYDGRSWNPQAGLSDRTVYTIIEDNAGVQWFGTDNGVYRFDGHTWQKPGLAGQEVKCIAQDTDGRLWFGTGRGVFRYNEEEQSASKWEMFTIADGLPDNNVHTVATESQGQVWVGTEKGLASYDGQSWTSHVLNMESITAKIFAVAVNTQGDVWIGTTQGVSQYDGRNWTTYTTENGLLSNLVTAIAIGRQGTLWFGTDKGVTQFDGQEWTSYTADTGLIEGAVTVLIVDSEGVVWTGTEQGVSRYSGQVWETFQLPQEIAGQKIIAIAEDRRVNAMCPLCEDIFYRHSTNGGQGWSVPINLSHSFAGSGKPQLHLGSEGDVYVTWEEGEGFLPGGGYPVGSMYVHSPDGGNTWSEPTLFSFAQGAPQQITLGADQKGNLVVVWRLPEEDVFYYQSSRDNGASWSQPETIPGVIAKPWESFSLDAYHTATDSAGHVHLLVLGYLHPLEEELALIHLVWNGSEWSVPIRIYASSDPPEWPRVDVGLGNKVYATWFTRDQEHIWNSERGRYKVWSSSYQAEAPPQTPVSISSPVLTQPPVASEQATATPVTTPTPAIVTNTSGLPPGLYTEGDEIGRLLLALSPIAVVVLAVVALRLGWFRRGR
jgi:hypothetical protein